MTEPVRTRRASHSKALWSGVCLIALALLGLWLNRNLKIGTAVQMGPGYLPLAVCILLAIVGVVLAAGTFCHADEDLEGAKTQPIVFVLGSIAFFAGAVETAGLVIAIAGLVLIGAGADRDTNWGQAVLIAALLSAFCAIVFVELLGLPIQLWPSFG